MYRVQGMFMVKKASNSPKTPKSVQKRPTVQNHVAKRIAELRNSGMGSRRISQTLKKEGLATISKSTVANYLGKDKAQSKISAKKLHEDPVLRALAKTEAKLQKQENKKQMCTQAHQRVRDLQLRRVETPEDRQGIFKNSQELKKFVQDTLYDSQVLKDFKLHCKADSLPLAKTLSDVTGSLDKYEAENEDMCGWPDLPSYIEEQLDNYLEDEQRRKRLESLQKKFSDFWSNFKCSKCGAPYDTMFILTDENVVVCNRCKEWYTLRCLECGGNLVFDANTGGFFCRKCNFVFDARADGPKEEEARQLLARKFFEGISKAECQNCTSDRIIRFVIVEGELVCTNCGTHYYFKCPRCKNRLSLHSVDVNTTEYRCPSCKLAFRSSQ